MLVKKLKLYNFRCFSRLEITFSNTINILTGNNATGKTSILEAVNYLALTKSFKTNDEQQLIKQNELEMSIIGEIYKDNLMHLYKVIKRNSGKQVLKDDYRYLKLSNYLGEILIVSFTNSDMFNLLGTARERRKIIEPIICQISRFYTDECNYYKKLLNERNALLKRLIFERTDKMLNLINIIDMQFVKCAKEIINNRNFFIEKVNKKLKEYHFKISENNEVLEIKYVPCVSADNLLEKLKEKLEEDIKKGSTSIGPHRDDYVFIINNKNITLYGSQGQQRSSLISTKLTFVEILKEETGIYPILILDEVLSDLDKNRQNNIFKILNENVQTLVSSSTLSELNDEIKNKAKIITLGKEIKIDG